MSGGYDRDFLRARLELPSPSATTILLDYIHFSVRFRAARKLAAIVGVNINGKELSPLAREGTWHFDDRIPKEQQAGPDVYKNNAFDRGHLVRRLDPVWGDDATAKKANQDTFVFTNAAPQVDDFNQGKELWVGLEDHVLEHADAYDAKLSVFTGPVLLDDDLPYRGVQVPRKFWKIAAWTNDAKLAAAGFVLDQSPLLGKVELKRAIDQRLLEGEPPPLGPFRTFQVPIGQIADLTGLSLSRLANADRLASGQRELGKQPKAIKLESPDQIRL
ncbi:DNA/RNA non-specific endonuclease [Paenarthrobacter aromaticivorans]|uniref:DNA/RNA non-specific endonuclease n=1 Tax=Paenarthrobacter aromaticivorans TaxID=2849150 RepID=A0ABS6IAL8_9MICC|nr:DNA/RNA non-specific endonuclease [Paenarthrobacter sp. MMS21-TAE1-1]MBU8867891.1 DNA/RNA non-specific endonuclease [Paenarthrobacter sp. MMS21-TAE1-1]